MIEIRNITNKEELDDFLSTDAEKKHLLKFGAEWCGPCRTLEQTLQTLDAERVKDVLFGEVSIESDETEDLGVDYKIRNIPVLIAIVNNKETGRTVGMQTAEQIYNLLGV